jgi:hypothetical protein
MPKKSTSKPPSAPAVDRAAPGSPLYWFAKLPLVEQEQTVLPEIIKACEKGNLAAAKYLVSSPYTRVIAHWVKTCYEPDEECHFMQFCIAIGVADEEGEWRDSTFLYLDVDADAENNLVSWKNWNCDGCSKSILCALLGDWIKKPFLISQKPEVMLMQDTEPMTLAEFIEKLRPWMANKQITH